MDYQKAFDTVPHKRLISKLKSYGFNQQMTSWIHSFLTKRTQQVVINSSKSQWMEVSSGIPQGSVLGPLLFVLFINDLPDSVTSQVFLFADDTKIFRTIKSDDDQATLQTDLNKLSEWSEKWLLKFHPGKCKHMHIGKATNNPTSYSLDSTNLESIRQEKGIGVIIDADLEFDRHISEKVKKATQMFALLRRSFQHMDETLFVPLYKSLVRVHLDFASSVWAPYKIKHVEQLEGVQRRITKQLPGMKDLPYPDRLQQLKLPTLSYRRLRGDLIEVFKITNGLYDSDCTNCLKLWKDVVTTEGQLRGHSKKLFLQRSRLCVREHSFALRVVPVWNKLSEDIVSAPDTDTFKSRLDEFMINRDIYSYMYNEPYFSIFSIFSRIVLDFQDFQDSKLFQDDQEFQNFQDFQYFQDCQHFQNFKIFKIFKIVLDFENLVNIEILENFESLESIGRIENFGNLENFESLESIR